MKIVKGLIKNNSTLKNNASEKSLEIRFTVNFTL